MASLDNITTPAMTICFIASMRQNNRSVRTIINLVLRLVRQSIGIFRKKVRKDRRWINQAQYDAVLYGKHCRIVQLARTKFVSILKALTCHIRQRNLRMIRNRLLEVKGISARLLAYKKISERRSFWVRPLLQGRLAKGEFNNLVREIRATDPEEHYSYFRMSRETFDELLQHVSPLLQRRHTQFCRSIEPQEQLAMTLRYLAQGDSQKMIAANYRVGRSTICRIINKTCKALWDVLVPLVLKPSTNEEWSEISNAFYNRWNFPNCLGAIDGKHVMIQAPRNSGSTFFNYKSRFSLVFLAACDAHYRFTLVDIGAAGKQSDGGVFAASVFGQQFGQQIEFNSIKSPQPKCLPGTDVIMPHVFVGDEAFPLLPNLLRPYPGKCQPLARAVYNYRVSRARRIAENTFGILAARWRIYRRDIIADVSTVENIVKATVVLHNYLRNMDIRSVRDPIYCPTGYVDVESPEGRTLHGQWRENVSNHDALVGLGNGRRGNVSTQARLVQTAFCDYFCSLAGEVEWQYEYVNRGKEPEM